MTSIADLTKSRPHPGAERQLPQHLCRRSGCHDAGRRCPAARHQSPCDPWRFSPSATFTKDNDPHGEHDFGSFEIEGETYFFKLDYYALDMDGGSEDPADPEKTTRVLTIMRADEY